MPLSDPEARDTSSHPRLVSGFSSEFQLLLLAARPHGDPAAVQFKPHQPVNWQRLSGLANKHGMAPLLWRMTRDGHGPELPSGFVSQLKDQSGALTRHNLLMSAELVRIVYALESRGALAIPYKGPILASLAYAHIGMRPFSDLDILIERGDYPVAREALEELGYFRFPVMPADEEALGLRLGYDAAFIKPGGALVELHWELAQSYMGFRLRPRELKTRLVPRDLAGRTIMTLGDADMLLILAMHGAKHLWDRLEWIASFTWLIHRSTSLGWGALLRQARQLRMLRMLLLALYLSRELLGLILPAEVEAELLRDPGVEPLARIVTSRLRNETMEPPGVAESTRFLFKVHEYRVDRVRFACRLALTPHHEDWSVVSLPPQFFWLYYLIRPFRLLHKYVTGFKRSTD